MTFEPRRKFKAKGCVIWAQSIYQKVDGGHSIKMGFPVAEVNDNLENSEKIAEAIAEALNKSPMDWR